MIGRGAKKGGARPDTDQEKLANGGFSSANSVRTRCYYNRKLFRRTSRCSGRLPEFITVLFAALFAAMFIAGCGRGAVKPGSAGGDENAFGEQAAPAANANKPSFSSPPVEVDYSMPEGMESKYTLHRLIVDSDGADGILGVEPFEISFILPEGWTVGGADERVAGAFQDITGEGRPLYQAACFVDDQGRIAAALSFAKYEAGSCNIESEPHKVYAELLNGKYRFLIGESYYPFYSGTASNLTAVTKTRYDRPDGAIQYNPAVLSVDPERGIYIAAEFAIGRINAIQFMDFAESIFIY